MALKAKGLFMRPPPTLPFLPCFLPVATWDHAPFLPSCSIKSVLFCVSSYSCKSSVSLLSNSCDAAHPKTFSVYMSGETRSGILNSFTLCGVLCWFMHVTDWLEGRMMVLADFRRQQSCGHFVLLRLHKIWPLYIPWSNILCMFVYAWEVGVAALCGCFSVQVAV